jgi:glycosyltransferase involved in cell wall biosynthesis
MNMPTAPCIKEDRPAAGSIPGETRLSIAQVAPLAESVPPRQYGGTERVVSVLTDALVSRGHRVTLFASGDSATRATLIPACTHSLRTNAEVSDRLAHHILQLEQVFSRKDAFDLIHFHIDYLHYPLSRRLHMPTVTTLHGRLDLPDLAFIYREFREMPLISISDSQRVPLPRLNWVGTIYHGLPLNMYKVHEKPGSYLAFLGRFSPEKRPDLAIDIAERAGVPIRIAAKTDPKDREYFREVVEPLLKKPHVDFIGEIDESEKQDFLGNALALLFPIDWPEPFGLVMIEAMACGTPVIAHRRGSVSEVMDDGVTGFVVDSVNDAVSAVGRIGELDRAACRAHFERRFNVDRMADEYVAAYRRLLKDHGAKPPQG